MAFNQTEKQEKEYLKQIISFLKKVIGNTDASVKDHVDTLAEYKDYIWSNKDIDPHEIRSMRESILNHFALGESVPFILIIELFVLRLITAVLTIILFHTQ